MGATQCLRCQKTIHSNMHSCLNCGHLNSHYKHTTVKFKKTTSFILIATLATASFFAAKQINSKNPSEVVAENSDAQYKQADCLNDYRIITEAFSKLNRIGREEVGRGTSPAHAQIRISNALIPSLRPNPDEIPLWKMSPCGSGVAEAFENLAPVFSRAISFERYDAYKTGSLEGRKRMADYYNGQWEEEAKKFHSEMQKLQRAAGLPVSAYPQ